MVLQPVSLLLGKNSMLAIKLKRIGKKKQPSYRVVIQEKRSKVLGKYIDDLGHYNPFTKAAELNKDRVVHWIKVGAQPTATVHNLLVRNKVIEGKKVSVHKKFVAKPAEAAPAPVAVEAPKEETAS